MLGFKAFLSISSQQLMPFFQVATTNQISYKIIDLLTLKFMAQNNYVLLTWNPSSKESTLSPEEFEKSYNKFLINGEVTINWRVSAHEEVKAGDCAIFLRQGNNCPGIFAFGQIISSRGKPIPKKKSKLFQVTIKTFSHPKLSPLIARSVLVSAKLISINLINTQKSGLLIPENDIKRLAPLIKKSLERSIPNLCITNNMFSRKKPVSVQTLYSDTRDDDVILVTSKKALREVRTAQRKFKKNLLKIEKCCRFTGEADFSHLKASHIKAWQYSKETPKERIDGHNGFFLVPHVDHLFDKGFISIANNGNVLYSNKLNLEVLKTWGLDKVKKIGRLSKQQKYYLKFHRTLWGFE